MRDELPPGWGFAPPVLPTAPRATPGPGAIRVSVMRFALWAARRTSLGAAPMTPGLIAATFAISYETARHWLADWNYLQEQGQR